MRNFAHEFVCRKLKCKTAKAFRTKYNQEVKQIVECTGLDKFLTSPFVEFIELREKQETVIWSKDAAEIEFLNSLLKQPDSTKHANVKSILLLSKKKIERGSKEYAFVKRGEIPSELGLSNYTTFKNCLETAIYELLANPLPDLTAADLAFEITYPKTFQEILDSILKLLSQHVKPTSPESLYRRLNSKQLAHLPI